MSTFLLGVDLGATKGLLGLFAPGAQRPVFTRRYACADHDGFAPMLERFVDEAEVGLGPSARRIHAACIGLAGPVDGGRARMTNLPWVLDVQALSTTLPGARLRLVNDFVAAAAGVARLDAQGWQALQPGAPSAAAPRLVLGPGTGLGVASMFPVEGRWTIVGGEGGHLAFAPRNDWEHGLWCWLAQTHGARVSAERVLSGPGLVELYRFLRRGSGDVDPLLAAADPAAAITAAAQAGAAPLAERALDLFAGMLGAFTGDLALLLLPRAGVYLAGGVAPRVLDARRTACFLEGFRDKGRHADLMSTLPVRLVLDPALGLLGAGALAEAPEAVLGG